MCTPLAMREYDQIAEWYGAARNPEVGAPDLAALARLLSPGARVLDLGCGNGIPITQLLIQRGCEVMGLDSSPRMIERYRKNFPGVAARCERVQEAQFAAEAFEAVVAWGVLFHLSGAEQAAVISKVAEWLKPGGRFLFTSGGTEGTAEGEMNGVPFQYVSLGASRYRHLVERAGMHLERHHRDAFENYVYIAKQAA